jgi:hypothetical protein
VICRYLSGVTILAALLFGPASKAQEAALDSKARVTEFAAERKEHDARVVISKPVPKSEILARNEKSPLLFNKKRFIFLSAAVYGASLADMHQTMHVRHYDWWVETDPLARPIVKLPAPAYYASGLALATGINWLSWKMGHSKRWHKMALIPQLLSIVGNTYGFKSNRYSNY